MSGDLKKRQELLKQIANRGQIVNIGLLEKLKEAIFQPKKFDIVDKTTTLSGQVETQKLILCFDYLNEDICTFDQLNTAKIRALVGVFKQITSCEVNTFPSTKITRGDVYNNPPYVSLFTKLSADVTVLKESELSEDGRLFFFITGNKFNIVSIEGNHRNLH